MRICIPPQTTVAPRELVDRLANSLELAQEAAKKASAPYQTSGEWLYLLSNPGQDLRVALNRMFRDPAQTPIGSSYSIRYLNSPLGHFKRRRILKGMQTDVAIWKTLFHQPLGQLAAPPVGSPWGVDVEGTLIYPGVCRADYFARQVSLLCEGGDIVAEIGAGYGEFAYRLLKMRRDVHYVCFDLPEILLRSSYFLMQALPDRRVLLFDGTRALTRELIKSFDIVLMPNFMLPQLEQADIMINTRSLSEMGAETVTEYSRQICRATTRYFLHENSNEPVPTFGDHREVPGSDFPLSMRPLSAQKSPWSEGHGVLGRYVQYLYGW